MERNGKVRGQSASSLGRGVFEPPADADGKRQREQEGAQVGHGLGHLDALQPEEARQHQQRGNEKQPLPPDGKQRGRDGHPYVLEEHIGRRAERAQRKDDALPAQGCGADFEHHGVLVAEQGHNLRRKGKTQGREDGEHSRRDAEGKQVGLAHTPVLARTVVEAAHGLEALREAENQREGKHRGARHDGKGGHRRGGLASRGISSSGVVEHYGRNAVERLAEQRRQAAGNDFAIGGQRRTEVAQGYVHRVAAARAHQQQAPGKELADGRGQRRAADAETEGVDEQRVEGNVEQGAADDAHHSEARVALEAQLVVERQGRHHKRRSQQDVAQIVAGVWHHVGRCAEQHHKLRQQRQTNKGGDDAEQQRREEAHGGHLRRVVAPAGTEAARDVVARAVAEEEAHGLDESHIGKRDADAGSGLGGEMADEGSVDDVVEGCDHHTDHRRHRQTQHQPRHRRARHFLVFGIK